MTPKNIQIKKQHMAFEGINTRPVWLIIWMAPCLFTSILIIVPFLMIIPMTLFIGGAIMAFWPSEQKINWISRLMGVLYLLLAFPYVVLFVMDFTVFYHPSCDRAIAKTLYKPESYNYIKSTNEYYFDGDDPRDKYSSIIHYTFLDKNNIVHKGVVYCITGHNKVELMPVDPRGEMTEEPVLGTGGG